MESEHIQRAPADSSKKQALSLFWLGIPAVLLFSIFVYFNSEERHEVTPQQIQDIYSRIGDLEQKVDSK